MARIVTVGIAQLGPIPRSQSRQDVVLRLLALMEDAARMGCDLVVYPEAALTAFFPHWLVEGEQELDSYFEAAMPNPDVQPLFDAARRLRVGFHLGYCELDFSTGQKRRFNTAILVGQDGEIIGKYRKIHLPGGHDFIPGHPFQNLEKRYFEVGDLGWPVWHAFGGRIGMMICNDRRWPESWRVMGLQQVELVMLGYNTPSLNMDNRGFEAHHLRVFHSHLSIQSGCYQNACFAVATAKAGTEDGHELFGHSIIVNPQGEIMAQATSWDDEVIIADCDLGMCELGRTTIFNFARHRRPEHYTRITAQTGSEPPPAWAPKG